MGAPSDSLTIRPNTNSTWEGFPKHYRYPYEITITNAVPEGYQGVSAFRTQLKNNNGKIHPNGGGYIENSTVSSSVYVGPYAIVKNSNLSGNVRIEGTAMVYNATLNDTVTVKDNAVIDRGTYSGRALISDNCLVTNATISGRARVGGIAVVENYKLHGTVIVGGDVVVYNDKGDCDKGTHYVLTNYYDNKMLECDGKDSTAPRNLDINSKITIDTTTCKAIINNSGKASICIGSSTTLNANSGTAFRWFLGPDPASFTTRSVKINSAGKYTVQVNNGICQEVSSAYAITVNPVPVISITSPANNTVVTNDIFPINTSVTGTNISSVVFYNGTSLMGTNINSPYNFTTPSLTNGTYSFSAIAKNTSNCTDTANVTVKVNKVMAGIEDGTIENDNFHVSPNPFTDHTILNYKGTFEYTILDLKGQELEKRTATNSAIIGSGLSTGAYFIRVSNGEKSQMFKAVKH